MRFLRSVLAAVVVTFLLSSALSCGFKPPTHAGASVISMYFENDQSQPRTVELNIYSDGDVILQEVIAPSFSDPNQIEKVIWYTGKLKNDVLDGLKTFVRNSGFATLSQTINYTPSQGAVLGDYLLIITTHYTDLNNHVYAGGYLNMNDMPYPLNSLYQRLWSLAGSSTNPVGTAEQTAGITPVTPV